MSYQNNFKKFLSRTPHEDSETLKQKEKNDLEAAINNSKETADLEEQQRKFSKSLGNDSLEDSVGSSKQVTKRNKLPANSKAEQEVKITFQDLLEASGGSLDIIYHTPIFNLPIITNPQYKKCSIQQKAKKLISYFTKIDKLKAKLARDSLQRAPRPKPILPSSNFTNSLVKNGLEEDNEGLNDLVDTPRVQETYVSRAGRQVKRKNYTEDAEVDSDPDFVVFNKKNKADDSDTKITLDIPYIPEENRVEEKPKPVKTRKDTPRRPSNLHLRKLSGSRSEILFDRVMQEDEKRKQQEEEMENFEKSLQNVEEMDEELGGTQTSPLKENLESEDSNFIRRRVVPPVPPRKGARGKKLTKQEIDRNASEAKSASPPRSPVLKRYTILSGSAESKSKGKARVQKGRENTQTPASSSKQEKTSCPICSREFLQSEIVNHAATCGDDDGNDGGGGGGFYRGAAPNSSFGKEKIICGLCDREFTVATDYEVHVQRCIASEVSDM